MSKTLEQAARELLGLLDGPLSGEKAIKLRGKMDELRAALAQDRVSAWDNTLRPYPDTARCARCGRMAVIEKEPTDGR